MEQSLRGTPGFPTQDHLYGNAQQYSPYDNYHHNTAADPHNNPSSFDASWGNNASNLQTPSAPPQQASAPSWPPHANHLSATSAGVNGQPSQYARSLSNSPSPYGQHPFNNYGALQNFQYRQQPQYDPALLQQHQVSNQPFNTYSASPYQQLQPNPGTVAPHALQHGTHNSPPARNQHDGSDYRMRDAPLPTPSEVQNVNQTALVSSIPPSRDGGYFRLVDFNQLSQATKTERMGNFVNISPVPLEWGFNRAALPAYVPRKSRNEFRKLAGNDPKILAKLGKKVVRAPKTSIIAPRSAQPAGTDGSPSAERIKYEGDSSSSEDSSSDDDESSYTSDDAAEAPPLPSKRPSLPREGIEYDTIKALWRSRRRSPNGESIRKGLVDFWEIAKTIRDRWKADSNAVADAEEKKRDHELPLLKSRVKDQRDMMEAAFKAAHKHGHRDIVELFPQNASLLFLCYQFLLDRTKDDDYNGPLARAILEVLALAATIKEETFEKTHLVKIIPRYVKRGDAKTQHYAKKIMSNVSAATTESKAGTPETKKDVSKVVSTGSPSTKRAEPEPVAGIKRAASTAGDGGAQKKVAVAGSRLNGTSAASKLGTAARKSSTSSDTAKPAAPAAATTVKPKSVTAKPSGLFASLQSASKKPGTSNASRPGGTSTTSNLADKSNVASAPKSTFSFTETMANLSKPKEEKPVAKPVPEAPKETPEEKAKRLRKESRRHLHVKFKDKNELTQVHVFQHDVDEDEGHDASQMRDVSDVGGEGRMFKQQHHMMDIDEDDEAAEEDEKLVEFKEPTEIDFNLDKEFAEEQSRNFARYGGGKLEPQSEERAKREHYEANNLMVVYASPSDIPPNPREPSDPYNGESATTTKKIAVPEEKYTARARQRKAGKNPLFSQTSTPTPGFDLSKLSTFLNAQQPAPPIPQQPAPPPLSNNMLSNLLASLSQNKPTPPLPALPPQFAPPPPQTMPTQAPPPGQPDLAAILAQITGAQQQQPQPPSDMPSYTYPTAASAAPNMMSSALSSVYENPERKQWRESGGVGGSGVGGGSESFVKRDSAKRTNPNYKTRTCKYWLEGRCQKGEECTYKHEE